MVTLNNSDIKVNKNKILPPFTPSHEHDIEPNCNYETLPTSFETQDTISFEKNVLQSYTLTMKRAMYFLL